MTKKAEKYCESFSMLIRSSLSEKYGLGAALARKCSGIFSKLLEQCQTRECCEITSEFLAQTEAEAEMLEEMRRYELNCEYARFIQSRGLEIESSGDVEARMTKLYKEVERLEKIFSQPLSHIDMSDSKEVYKYCFHLRKDLTRIIELLSQVSEQTRQQEAFQEMVELLQHDTNSLAENFHTYSCENNHYSLTT